MSRLEWKLVLKRSALTKTGRPDCRTYPVSPGLTENDIVQDALAVFAPSAVRLGLRAASNIDYSVNLRLKLDGIQKDDPSPHMAPDWATHTCMTIWATHTCS
ncbi:TPA: hypothetical protein ACH3X1_000688 [Trebouxia sp. C0004]